MARTSISTISFFQQWYAAQVTMLCSWLSERLDHNLHPYQCTCLAHIVKVSLLFNCRSWQTVSMIFSLIVDVPKYVHCICQFLLLCWLRLNAQIGFIHLYYFFRKFFVLGYEQKDLLTQSGTDMHYLDQKSSLFCMPL